MVHDSPAASKEDRLSLFRRYGLALLRRWWIILITTLSALAAGYVYTKRQPLIYHAVSKVIISLNAPQILPDFQQVSPVGSGNYWDAREYYATQYAIIRGRRVAERAVKKLALDKDAAFLGQDPASLDPKKATEIATSLVVAQISVEPIPESLIVRIICEDTDKDRATRLVNAVTEAYIRQNLDAALETAGEAADDLGNQIGDLESSLKKSEEALLAFRKENVLISPRGEGGISISDQTLFSLKAELGGAQKARRQLAARREQIKQLERDGDLLSVAADVVLKSELISGLKKDYIEAQRDLLDLKTKYLEKHPSVIAQEEKVAWLKENLDREIKNVLESIEVEYKTAVSQEKEISNELDKAQTAALEIAEKELLYHQLKRKVEDDEKLFGQVQQRYREIGFTEALTGNNVELLEAARTPGGPSKPNLSQNLFLAFFAGLIGGIALALGFEFVDSTLKTEGEAEEFFGTPFLGIIPALKGDALSPGESADLYVHHRPHSPLAESCRSIRTNLLFTAQNKGLHTLLVTSASPKEGKTTTTINLGITMANSGSRTLLVDTDMRRPRIHKTFGWENDRGLTTAILGEAGLDEVVRETQVPGLFVLPCGPIPPNPSELIGGEKFQEISKQLCERFDRVIFDSPPVIAVTDAIVLSTQVDGVVVVASAGKTTRDLARQTSQRLKAVNAPSLGVVMNAVDLESKEYSYAYYYNRYGYYGESPSEKKTSKKSKKKAG